MSFFGNIEGSVWYRSPNRHSNEGILFWNEPTTWIQMTQILLQTQIYNYYVSRLEPDLVCQKVSILDISWYVIWIHLDIFSKPCLFFLLTKTQPPWPAKRPISHQVHSGVSAILTRISKCTTPWYSAGEGVNCKAFRALLKPGTRRFPKSRYPLVMSK